MVAKRSIRSRIKWKVQPKETGRYASFQRRGWPSAEWEGGKICAWMNPEDGEAYYPNRVADGSHAPIVISIADYGAGTGWMRKTLKRRAATVQEAKDLVAEFFETHTEYMPEEMRP